MNLFLTSIKIAETISSMIRDYIRRKFVSMNKVRPLSLIVHIFTQHKLFVASVQGECNQEIRLSSICDTLLLIYLINAINLYIYFKMSTRRWTCMNINIITELNFNAYSASFKIPSFNILTFKIRLQGFGEALRLRSETQPPQLVVFLRKTTFWKAKCYSRFRTMIDVIRRDQGNS